MIPRTEIFVAVLLLGLPIHAIAEVKPTTHRVGVAKVDITPTYPVRLNGFGGRRAESEGVYQRIWAKAMAIEDDGKQPIVVITVDVLGIPDEISREIAQRLAKKAKIVPERVCITATHTHTAPMLSGANPTLFGVPIPKEHLANIDRYTKEFIERLESVALAALADRQPANLYWAIGKATFAVNRRTRGGPVDHDMPMLMVQRADGKVRAVWANYACHCVTLSFNKIGGDWAGYAQQAIEDQYPDSIALISVGCGADSNPDSGVTGDKVEIAARQGAKIAKEVERLRSSGFLQKLDASAMTVSRKTIELPLSALPPKMHWETLAQRMDAIGHHARVQLEKLGGGQSLITKIPYPITTWTFADQLAMVFLPGEVVVDYAIRLKKELDGRRLFIHAYANDDPCYIPSERILKEGGYEGGGAMVYYDVPTAFATGLEASIITTVESLVGKKFASLFDPNRTSGSLPLSPHQSLATIRTHSRFRVDLVASEPLVADPVAIDFGPDGKLWVAEMIDYPSGKKGAFEPGGRVSFLDDSDGDGRFDRSTVFIRDIPFPTGVTVWRKGVLICAAPDILYAEDTDGDGKADLVQKLYSGFGTGNYQARVNSLEYGLDGWVYGSCGLFGGDITSLKTGKVTRLGDRDFRIRPDTGEIEPATGRTQQGRVRNDWGDWFGCDNSNLIRQYVLEDHYLRRNPHIAPPNISINVPTGTDPNQLYPASESLQRFKLSGPANRVTAACGLGIYRDELLGLDVRGNSFTCEPVNLAVHRRTLVPSGVTFVGHRPEEESQSEFLSGTDPWFRPVQARTGPDGALWVVDMYRFVIEHPRWIPKEDADALDLRAGEGMGRIYRVRPSQTPLRTWAKLDALDTAGLVAAIDSPNGWQRDMATRLLMWRKDRSAVPPLVAMAKQGTRPETRLHALITLDALEGLTVETLRTALRDSHIGVRRHAVRLSESHLRELSDAIINLSEDGDPFVRQQVALTLGMWQDPRASKALARLAIRNVEDPYLRAAVMSSINVFHLPGVIDAMIADSGSMPSSELLRDLLRIAGTMSTGPEMNRLLEIVARPRHGRFAVWQFHAIAGMIDKLNASQRQSLTPLLQAGRELASNGQASESDRIAAIAILGTDDREALTSLLTPNHPVGVQIAAVTALSRIPENGIPAILLADWAAHTPMVRSAILDAILAREAWQPTLLMAIESKAIAPSHIDLPRRQRLLSAKNPALKTRAEKVFAGAIDANRQQVLDHYQPITTKDGDRVKGKAIFGKICAACHALEGVGTTVGPDLAASAGKTSSALLLEILDPNRNLDSRYLEYRAITKSGKVITGLLTAETATSITLRAQQGKDETILRSELDELQTSGRSLMPEGLEKDIPPADMADLLAYLRSQSPPFKRFPGNQPTLIASAGGIWTLSATSAEIYGREIVFEPDFRNIGFWHGSDDRVTWRVAMPKSIELDVWLDYSCANDGPTNRFIIEGSDRPLAGTVQGTGGWDRYRRVRVGSIRLPVGTASLTIRPEMAPRGALMDLRTVWLLPVGKSPPEMMTKVRSDPKTIAARILNDGVPREERERLIRDHLSSAAEIIREMTRDLPMDTREEYRRIPWIWRVSIAAGRTDDFAQSRAILDVALPKKGDSLRDWQVVVIGGGLINGISLEGRWPGPRMTELLANQPELRARWEAALMLADDMADDEKVPTGTRYDALRMIALEPWSRAAPRLQKYLAKDMNAELQQGAVSGLVDVESPEAAQLLVQAIPYLPAGNRKFAIDGLLRTPERAMLLLNAIANDGIGMSLVDDGQKQSLRTFQTEAVRRRALEVLGK